MDRVPEPELMEDEAQALAYAEADFEQPHALFVRLFAERWPGAAVDGRVLDLGCGPADITARFAFAHPLARIDGVDGSGAMLRYARIRLRRDGLTERVRLIQGRLPAIALEHSAYDAVISNSLLHHLNDPGVLWRTVNACARPRAPVFVMDLLRPADRAAAEALTKTYAEGEPEVLRHDFFHSLLAAYRPDEVRAQLAAAGLDYLEVAQVSDRHLLISGEIGGQRSDNR